MKDRIEMCELAVSRSDFMMVDLWECHEPVHHDALQVCSHIQQTVSHVALSIPSVRAQLEKNVVPHPDFDSKSSSRPPFDALHQNQLPLPIPPAGCVHVVLAMGGDLLYRMQELPKVIQNYYVVVMKRDDDDKDLDSAISNLYESYLHQKKGSSYSVLEKGKEQPLPANDKYSSSGLANPKEKIIILPEKYSNTQIQNLSSTLVRNRLLHEKSIDGLVPTPVVDYIENHNLWKEKEN